MKKEKEILQKYYQGETSIEEERLLKAAFRKGNIKEEQIFTLGEKECLPPPGLMELINKNITRRKKESRLRVWITWGSVAASLILIISLYRSYPSPTRQESIQLTDNMKKERFENALRVIGSVLEEKPVQTERVLYENNKLIITIE